MSYLALNNQNTLHPSFFTNEVESLLNQCFNSPECTTASKNRAAYSPAVDVHESDDAFVITADVPGITKEALKIDILEDSETIQGDRKYESDEKKDQYHRIERSYGNFKRQFKIPGGFVHDKTNAVFENGVLTLTLPKLDLQKPKRIEVSGN